MKPAPFDYVRPDTLAEACEILLETARAVDDAFGEILDPDESGGGAGEWCKR